MTEKLKDYAYFIVGGAILVGVLVSLVACAEYEVPSPPRNAVERVWPYVLEVVDTVGIRCAILHNKKGATKYTEPVGISCVVAP